jgi:glutaredoxin
MFLLFVLEGCPYCKRAIELLKLHKAKYQIVVVPQDQKIKDQYKKDTGMKTFPMVFVSMDCKENEHYLKIGGSTDLDKYFQKIDEMRMEGMSSFIIEKIVKNIKK